MDKSNTLVKVILVGNPGVGKTSLVQKYVYDKFTLSYISTIGIDFNVKYLTIRDKNYKLQIWDTAGQERFKSIVSSYYRGVQIAIIVYDVTQRASFQAVKNWIADIEKHRSPTDTLIIGIVGNKTDLPQRRVTYEEGRKLADEYNCYFAESNAKFGDNVNQIFMQLTERFAETNQPSHTEPTIRPKQYSCCF